ncbi:hypothetical protein AMEX_G22897 [Astyanax mexicanus]|uniref:Uncharacterized protein n=1 Tax=Astyanax mexicanus TaxID=7994 RepID=A0A8T2KYN7_ASTMX|nr:hypothetical protein AMEX_G22897 [Astyanax mexicanus]
MRRVCVIVHTLQNAVHHGRFHHCIMASSALSLSLLLPLFPSATSEIQKSEEALLSVTLRYSETGLTSGDNRPIRSTGSAHGLALYRHYSTTLTTVHFYYYNSLSLYIALSRR